MKVSESRNGSPMRYYRFTFRRVDFFVGATLANPSIRPISIQINAYAPHTICPRFCLTQTRKICHLQKDLNYNKTLLIS